LDFDVDFDGFGFEGLELEGFDVDAAGPARSPPPP
jgi:hypothetical protein